MVNVKIDGVLVTPQKRMATSGGDVFHAMKAGDPGYAGFGEAYFSTVLPDAIKPWKRHNRMTLNLVVIAGEIRFVIHDNRPTSGSCGVTQVIKLGPDSHFARLTIAPGLWMAFQCIGDQPGILINIADMKHDPTESDRKALQDFFFDWNTI